MKLHLVILLLFITGCIEVDKMPESNIKFEDQEIAYNYQPDQWNHFILSLKPNKEFQFQYMYIHGLWAEMDSIYFIGTYKKEGDKLTLDIKNSVTHNFAPHPPGTAVTTEQNYTDKKITLDLTEDNKFITLKQFPEILKFPSYKDIKLEGRIIKSPNDTLDFFNQPTPCDVTPKLGYIKDQDKIIAKKLLTILFIGDYVEVDRVTSSSEYELYEYNIKATKQQIIQITDKLSTHPPPFSPFDRHYELKKLEDNKYELDVDKSKFILTFEERSDN